MHKSTHKRLVLHSEKIRVLNLHGSPIRGGNPQDQSIATIATPFPETPTSYQLDCPTPQQQ